MIHIQIAGNSSSRAGSQPRLQQASCRIDPSCAQLNTALNKADLLCDLTCGTGFDSVCHMEDDILVTCTERH